MPRQISFRITKGWLVFDESELMEALKSRPEVLEQAIRQGKLLSRVEKEDRRIPKAQS